MTIGEKNESKGYATKQPMGHWRNQEKILKYLERKKEKEKKYLETN